MQYTIKGSSKIYSFHYQGLRLQYEKYIALSDELFLSNLSDIIHYACFVCYIKELGLDDTIGDEGIIHQLVHLLTIQDPLINLKEIRQQFETLLKLC